MGAVNPAGRPGEAAAAVFLRNLGYRILERNYRCPAGEIDLVAEHGDTLVFVEVKSRSSVRFGTPAAAVTRSKQRHIARAASDYLLKHREQTSRPCRFDVVALLPGRPPELIPDAFRLER